MRLDKKTKKILLAMSLGDGYINPKGYLHILHSINQKEYVIFKYKLIEQLCNYYPKTYRVKDKRKNRTVDYHYKIYFSTRIHKYLKAIRKVLYKDNKKTFTLSILNNIDELGLAIWWMDDGNRYEQKRNGRVKSVKYTLATNLDRDENQVIMDWFANKWGIKTSQYKQHNGKYNIVFFTKEGRKFSDIIRDYVIPSMQYKVNPLGEVGNSSKREN